MCEECEEIEPLTVAYFGKARGGWRPPVAARTAPVNDDRSPDASLDERVVSGRPYAMPAPRFVCEPEGGGARAREVD
jgi:hypothetical protein